MQTSMRLSGLVLADNFEDFLRGQERLSMVVNLGAGG
jgi:hypothetical protein